MVSRGSLNVLVLLISCGHPDLPEVEQVDTGEPDAPLIEPPRDFMSSGSYLAEQAPGEFSSNVGGFELWIDGSGASFSSDGQELGLQFAVWGRDGHEAELQYAPPERPPCRDLGLSCFQTVEMNHSQITEWWQVQPFGVQHGWTVHQRPEGAGPLWFDTLIDVPLLESVTKDTSGSFVDLHGTHWTINGIAAWDAEGTPLEAWLEEVDNGYRVAVDDSAAVYPIEVDPILIPAQATFTPATDSTDFAQKTAVTVIDVNGDNYEDIIIGSPMANSGYGKVEVFFSNASGAQTTASQTFVGTDNESLGFSVAGLGSVNGGDSYNDVAFGAPTDSSTHYNERASRYLSRLRIWAVVQQEHPWRNGRYAVWLSGSRCR